MKIAVYGKGGIGKSTISANLSAALAEKGYRVLQIGCDPKHDSTRLLLGGRIPATVLQYVREVPPPDRQAEDIVFRGYGNVACVEAGGPEPGVGCAGRGIITTFEVLEVLGVKASLFDITLYDVLGDVVCGGFAVPIRNEYADAVYIVTSGEYLSLYAANNILRGLRNFTGNGGRVAGLIFNARGGREEEGRVTRFAMAARLPVVVRIPRSGVFAKAEEEGRTLIEKYPGTDEAAIFRALADHVDSLNRADSKALYPALPLDDEELERIVLSRQDTRVASRFAFSGTPETASRCISHSVKYRKPLFGCAFAGAVTITAQVIDAATVMHCPRSCALMVLEKLLATEHASTLISGQGYRGDVCNRLVTTDLTEDDFIFGGEEKLHDTLESVINKGYGTVFIITACPPGLTGDNIGKVSDSVSGKHPGTHVIHIGVDGNIAGDGQQGRLDAYRALSCLIDTEVSPGRDSLVNIIAEKWGAANSERDLRVIFDYLDYLGIAVNCRFVTGTTIESIRGFNRAQLNLPSDLDDTMESIMKIISPRSSVPFFPLPLPTGFSETRDWLLGLGKTFGEEEKAREMISREEPRYMRMIGELKPGLEGKTVLISTYPRSFDWICDIAEDLGMEILKAGITFSPFTESFQSRYMEKILIENGYTPEKRSEDIRLLKPDLVLYTYPSLGNQDQVIGAPIPYCPGYGFFAALEHARLWKRLLAHSPREGWREDRGVCHDP